MPDKTIDALPSGSPAQAGDLLPISRNVPPFTTFNVTASSIAALAPAPPVPTPETISAFPLPSVAQGVLWRSSATVNGYVPSPTSGQWDSITDIVAGGFGTMSPTWQQPSATAGATITITGTGNAQSAGQSWFTCSRKLTMKGTIQYSSSGPTAVAFHYAGFGDWYDNPIVYNNLVAIAVNKTGTSNGNFQLWVQYVPSPPTIVSPVMADSGIPVVDGQRYLFELVVTPPNIVTLSINGVQVATLTTTLPTASLAINWGCSPFSTASSSATSEWLYAEQVAP